MSPALQAHLRLSTQLPRRTHEWRPVIQEGLWGRKRSHAEKAALRAEFAAMRANGKTNREICELFHCTNFTILKLIGKSR